MALGVRLHKTLYVYSASGPKQGWTPLPFEAHKAPEARTHFVFKGYDAQTRDNTTPRSHNSPDMGKHNVAEGPGASTV